MPAARLDAIAQSHARCEAYGLSRIERPEFEPLGRADTTLVRERNRRLHAHAAPAMEMLHGQIVDTSSMVVLCDAAGTILHRLGDDNYLARASKVALSPGVSWSESSKGTNAIGTALFNEVPTLVHAEDHHLHANHFLTSSAAPILDPRGHLLGVLDVTGDQRSYHPHTMALVTVSARLIENHGLANNVAGPLRLHFHARPECLGTWMEGILAVAPDGRVVGANRAALDLLGVSSASLRQHSLASLPDASVAVLADHFRSPPAPLLGLHLPDGRGVHVQAHFSAVASPRPMPMPMPTQSRRGADAEPTRSRRPGSWWQCPHHPHRLFLPPTPCRVWPISTPAMPAWWLRGCGCAARRTAASRS